MSGRNKCDDKLKLKIIYGFVVFILLLLNI